ncbi:ABC transporter substrate-binding protein [Enemella sp. A6]|uniref:ABC transporter substrate-binding protein n=1 Tax=Enemella sp. A6 TaxID=3440152 RepID=UPI003EBF2269
MKRLFRKAGVVLMTAGALTLAACGGGSLGGGGQEASDDVIKIGLMVPETGTYAPLGEQMRDAAEFYLKQQDDKFGDRKVELVIADTAANPETAKSKAKELMLRDGVDVITGLVASPAAATVAEEANANKVPIVIANAGADDLTKSGASKYVWRVSYQNYQHGYAAGVYAAKEYGPSGGVFIGADYSAGAEYRDGFIDGYKSGGGGELAAEIMTPFGKTQNYQPFLGQIPKDAKFVVGFYAGGEAITFVKNWEEFGYKKRVPLIGAQNLTDEDILPAIGDAGLDVITVGMYSPALDNPANEQFLKDWQAEFDGRSPSVMAVATTDAMKLIHRAAEGVEGDLTAEALADALGQVDDLESPRGPMEIDPDTHNPNQKYYVRKLEKDGDWYRNTVIDEVESKVRS